MNKIKKQRCNLCNSVNYKLKYNIAYKDIIFKIAKCEKCGLVFQNPLPTDKQIKEMYDKDYFNGKGFDEGVNYYEGLKNKEAFDYIATSRIDNIEKFIKKGKILDIGCGMGDFLDVAKKKGWNTHGVELSEYSSKIAKEKFGLDIFQGKIEDKLFKQKGFDAIIMIEVIEHLDNPKETLKRCNKIMKKDGLIVIGTADIGSIYARIKGKNWSYILLGHLHYFSKKTLVKMLTESGFKVIKVYNGDEISLLAKTKSYWYKKDIGISTTLGYIKNVMIHYLRKIGIGGMAVYATKMK